jgi:hypothetical protein
LIPQGHEQLFEDILDKRIVLNPKEHTAFTQDCPAIFELLIYCKESLPGIN